MKIQDRICEASQEVSDPCTCSLGLRTSPSTFTFVINCYDI